MRHVLTIAFLALGLTLAASGPHSAVAAAGPAVISLPKPQVTGGKPLMEAMAARKSDRKFSARPLAEQDLSNILWAAFGVSRDDGKRTIPTARNRQDLEVYAVMESGVWRYDAKKNELAKVLDLDARSKFGGAPLTLLYAGPTENASVSGMHSGSAYQNVGLYCASAGLNNVVKTTGIKELDGTLTLPGGYAVNVVHSIGWPE